MRHPPATWPAPLLRALPWAAAAILCSGSLLLLPHGDLQSAASFPGFFIGAATLLVGWSVALAIGRHWNAPASAAPFWFGAALSRIAMLPMVPGDDLWRYLWEGRIQVAGFSPYLHPPADPALEALRTPWWESINHPGFSAIYPPPLELLFALLALPGASPLLFKAAFTAADLALAATLARHAGRRAALLFAWNPIVLYVTAGGGHFESLVLLPLVLAALHDGSARSDGPAGAARTGLLVGLAIGAKWVALPFLGFATVRRWRRDGWRGGLACLAAGAAPVALGAAIFILRFGSLGPPVPTEFIARARAADLAPWLVESLRGGPLEFNDGFTYAILVATVLIVWRARSWAGFGLAFFGTYLALLPSVHAWYFAYLFPWAALAPSAAALALSFSGWAYFTIHWRAATGGPWHPTPAARLALWLPFLAGAALDIARWLRSRHRPPP